MLEKELKEINNYYSNINIYFTLDNYDDNW